MRAGILGGFLSFGESDVPFTFGNWTPADGSGAGLVFATAQGTYAKQGRVVIAQGRVVYPATADASAAVISGLPFTLDNVESNRQGFISYSDANLGMYALPTNNAQTVKFFGLPGTIITNAQLSGKDLYFSAIYFTA